MFLRSLLAGFLILQLPAELKPPPPPNFKNPVDYRAWFEQRIRGSFRESDNAAPLYEKLFGVAPLELAGAGAALGFCGPSTDPDNKDKHGPGPWDPAAHPNWEAAYQKTAATRKAIAEAAARPYALFPWKFDPSAGETPSLFDAVWPHAALRVAARGVLENAWRAPDGKADPAAILSAIRTELALARQLDGQVGLIAHLASAAIRALAYDSLVAALHHDVFEPQQRAAVLALLEQNDPPAPSLRRALLDELAIFYDFLQVSGDPQRVAQAPVSAPIRDAQALQAAPQVFADAVTELLALTAQPYKPDAADSLDRVTAETRKRNVIAGVALPAAGRTYVLSTRCEAQRRGTRLLYAIFVHRDKSGKWPRTLNDLPRALIEAVATDPFSNQAFVYKLDGESFTLYSVAQNGVDDGGKHDPKWGDKEPGRDYVFWPRPNR